MNHFDLALRIERLRVARRVRFDELAAAIDLPVASLRLRLAGDVALSDTELWSISCALEAPHGWPEHEPVELPTQRIALSSCARLPAFVDEGTTPLPPRISDALEPEAFLGCEVLREL